MMPLQDALIAADVYSLTIDLLKRCLDDEERERPTRAELAARVWDLIKEVPEVVDFLTPWLLAGRMSSTWYLYPETINVLGLLEEMCTSGWNPLSRLSMPADPGELIKGEPYLYAVCAKETESGKFSVLRYAVREADLIRLGIDAHREPRISYLDVVLLPEEGLIEVRGEPSRARRVMKHLGGVLEVSMPETFPGTLGISDIADRLQGQVIDVSGKPGVAVVDVSEEESLAIAGILAVVEDYINTGDFDMLKANIDEYKGLLPPRPEPLATMFLRKAGMLRIAAEKNIDLRGQPLYAYMAPFIEHRQGFVRFPMPGREPPDDWFTLRIGFSTRSIYFVTFADEEVISYVRDTLISGT